MQKEQKITHCSANYLHEVHKLHVEKCLFISGLQLSKLEETYY
jgi:hypothetical protein